MNLLLRLLWLTLVARFRPAVSPFGPCRTRFRVLPTDLDVLRHMNNGVYLSLMDLGRVDLLIRAGVATQVRARGWYPVIAAETIRFRRSLTLFQAFDIETRVLGWDERAFVIEQRFERGETLVAAALVRARFLSTTGERVTPAEVLALVGVDGESPALPGPAARWNAEQAVAS